MPDEKLKKYRATVELTLETTDTIETLKEVLRDVILANFLFLGEGEDIVSIEMEERDA